MVAAMIPTGPRAALAAGMATIPLLRDALAADMVTVPPQDALVAVTATTAPPQDALVVVSAETTHTETPPPLVEGAPAKTANTVCFHGGVKRSRAD